LRASAKPAASKSTTDVAWRAVWLDAPRRRTSAARPAAIPSAVAMLAVSGVVALPGGAGDAPGHLNS
jgi:hypothetical protein